jgi:hypothetical protein
MNLDNSPDSPNEKKYDFKNVKGHVTITNVKGNNNETTISVTG